MTGPSFGEGYAALHASRRNHWNAHLTRHAQTYPSRPALRFEDRTITWLELLGRVEALAGALARRGVGEGDRVAVLMGNRPEFVETLLAVTRLGALAVPVNFRLTGPEAAYVLEDSGAVPLLVDDFAEHVARAVAEQTPEPVPAIVVGPSDWEAAESYEQLLAEPGTAAPVVDVSEDSHALIMYTSGTTGRPKGALLTHQNLLSQSMTYIAVCRLETGHEVNLVAAPMFHIAAIGSIAPMLLLGGTIVVLRSGAFDAAQVLGLLERERVNNVFLVPTQWQALCDHPTAATRDLSTLRTLSWGAAPATDALLRQMATTFPAAQNVSLFGQTEMSPVTCALDGHDALRKLGSIGKPVPSVAIRIVDQDMNDVPDGEVGEIVYRGAGLMSGYWNKPEATAEAFRGGWFHSGDLVRRDEEGFLYVVDRAKDMIISGGENIYCAEVENVLAHHPEIQEVSVVGRAHEKWGETPVAVVVWRDPQTGVAIEDLRSWAAAHLARYKLPTAVEAVGVLPRNPSGKVLKTELRRRFGSGADPAEETNELGAVPAPATTSEVSPRHEHQHRPCRAGAVPMTAGSGEPAALYRVRDGIAVITLNRPSALNAVNADLSTAVGRSLADAAKDPEVRVVVITGTGRAFCAGADLKELAQQKSIHAHGHPEWGFAGLVRHWIDKPVIAAVNGFAMGGGTEIALSCDLVVAADTAVFGLPEVKRGLLAAAGGVVRLQRQLPLKRALELALTGDGIDAATAEAWGLVNKVVPAESVLDETLRIAARIAANAPLSVQHTKQMIHRTATGVSDWNADWAGEDPWQVNAQATRVVFASADALEGPRAFAEKRAPEWSGR